METYSWFSTGYDLTNRIEHKCCDTTNNTPDIISRNELVVDIYIKPTYVAEFIQLRVTNAGVNSFSSVIGG